METTTVIYLKSGKFAIHPARGPVVTCKKDEVVSINPDYAKVLADAGWAEIIEVEVEELEGEDVVKSEGDTVPPWEQEDWNPEADNAKDMLEAYGLGVFDVDIDKRKSVEKLIEQLQDLKELTGDN